MSFSKVCLFEAEILTPQHIMECRNSKYDYVYPNGNASSYMIREGNYVVYAIDNVGNSFSHNYIFENVSRGISFSVTTSTNGITGGTVTLTATVNAEANEYNELVWSYLDTDSGEWINDLYSNFKYPVEENI